MSRRPRWWLMLWGKGRCGGLCWSQLSMCTACRGTWSRIVVAAFTATAGRSGVMSASWKMRWLVFGVAIVDNVHAARWNALVPLVIVAVLSGTTAVLRRRWLAALRDLGDRQVIIEGLGPVLAAMIRSRSRSVSDLARADTLDQRHTGRDAELQPAVRKRACR